MGFAYARGSGDEPATKHAASARQYVVKVDEELQKIFGSVMDKDSVPSANTGVLKVLRVKRQGDSYPIPCPDCHRRCQERGRRGHPCDAYRSSEDRRERLGPYFVLFA